MSSSPMFRRPTVGRALPVKTEQSAAPMTANWRKCSAVQSTFAPKSNMIEPPSECMPLPAGEGITDAIAGRSMPGKVLSTNREVAMSAPVLPALTQASASPFFTASKAKRSVDCFLFLSASAGDSSMPTTSVATTRVTRFATEAGRYLSANERDDSSPTSTTCASGRVERKLAAAGSVTAAP